MFFAIPNLMSQVARRIENPWSEPLAPDEQLKASKVSFSEWCMSPSTKHCFFNMAEGMDPLRRVSDSEENRVVCLHGFVADIDREIPDEHFTVEYITKKSRSEFLPNYASRTHSGNGRLVWMFSTPVYVPNQETATAFYEELSKKLKLKSIWGMPDPASFKPNQYYERGRDWLSITNDTIPTNMLEAWLFESGRHISFTEDEKETQIPWEAIDEKFHATYPNKWNGKIEEGARGPAFWRDTKSGNSAVVRKGGIQDFGGDFMPWSKLLGAEWVAKIYADRIGSMLKKVWFDGTRFYTFDPENPGPIVEDTHSNLEQDLQVEYNLSTARIDGKTYSQLDEIMVRARKKRIDAAGPFLYHPPGLIRYNNKIFLNSSLIRVIDPAPDPIEVTGGAGLPIPFGHGFPFLRSLFMHQFPKDRSGASPLEYFLSWLRYAYANAYYLKPKRGQVALFVGTKDAGKSVLLDGVITQLLGGLGSKPARPFKFATEKTNHNDEMLNTCTWSLDDEHVKTEADNAAYTNFLKQSVALDTFRLNPKFKKEVYIPWAGRVLVAFNEDAHSGRQMPNVDASVLDKIMMFRVKGGFKFLPREEQEAKIAEELPHLARWLLNWRIPDHCIGSPRFGVKAYHDPLLLRTAYENGANFEFAEMLKLFLESFETAQRNGGTPVTEWVGSSSQLLLEMSQWNSAASKAYNSRGMGRSLSDLMDRGLNIRMVRTPQSRTWYIPVKLEINFGLDPDGTSESGDYDTYPLSEEDINKLNVAAATVDVTSKAKV